MGVIGEKDSLPFVLIFFFDQVVDFTNALLCFRIAVAEICKDHLVSDIELLTGITKALDTAVGRNGRRNIGIYVDQDVTVVFYKETGSLYGSHIVVSIDAADMFCFTLNSDDRNLIGSELFGWKRVDIFRKRNYYDWRRSIFSSSCV